MTKKTKSILQAIFLAFLVIASYLIITNHRKATKENLHLQPGTQVLNNGFLKNEGNIFGTFYHVTYQSNSDLKQEIESTMQAVDNSLSMFNKHSTVSLINQGVSNKADSLFQKVFKLSKTVYAATKGCFDPTVAPLVNAWGFGFKNDQLPNEAQVDSLKALVGFERINLNHGIVTKADSLMVMDFSAIAKGFGVDQVAALLESKGIQNYMVEIGGEVIVKGRNQKGKPWKVGIAKPTEDAIDGNNPQEEGLQEVLNLENKAMATSGNYRNYYITQDGRKLAHTIDPHSGYPVQHSILSSTVFAPTCAMADAYATAFMVMGLDDAKKVLVQNPQLQVYFIYSNNAGEYKVYSTIPLDHE